MRTELTQAQIDSYQRDGFIVIEGFLNADELERWRRVTEEAVAARIGRQAPEGQHSLSNQGNPDDYYAQVFTQALQLINVHDEMRELMTDPRIGKMACELAGVDGMRIWHDQALIKPPFGNPTAWHLDNPYWSFYHRASLSIWIALDDATPENGCMYYIPGSHRQAEFERNVGIGTNIGDLFRAYPEWRAINPVSAAAPAGSAVWHSGLTAHGAGANMTNRPRRAMTCGFMPDGATFNGQQNILPRDYFESLTIGDVLDNDEQNPKVWPVNGGANGG